MTATGLVSYKKKDGKIVLKEHNLEWSEKGVMLPSLSIALSAVKNLQASPATASSASMRIFAAASLDAEPVAHTFKFTSKDGARAEMDLFVVALQTAIAAKKAASVKTVVKPSISELQSHDVEADSELQEALLKANAELASTFREAVINGSITPSQFWSSRTHLLRAFLVEQSQSKGPYNVLATIRPKTIDNKITVNMTREKIRDIFAQHPLLRRIYDETVPPLGEDEFWSRFFVSRLCKKLRGERIVASDPNDDKLDKYLAVEESESRARAREEEKVRAVMDIEGNEEHHSKKLGNAPDFTMRPSRTDVVNSINSISVRMLDSLAPNVEDRMDDDYYHDDLELSDLRGEEADARVILNIRDQRNFFSHDAAPTVKVRDTSKTLSEFKESLPDRLDITSIGASAQIDATTEDIFQQIAKQADRQVEPASPFTIQIMNQMTLSLSATQEFLNLFWSHFLSGDATKAKALSKMADSLRKTKDRISAIANKADDPDAVIFAMSPILKAVERALSEYARAVESN